MGRRRAFTLAEVMVAMLFVSIAMFGYIGLHMRILHSSTTLQHRHNVRRKVDLYTSQVIGVQRFQASTLQEGTQELGELEYPEWLTPYLVLSKDEPGNEHSGNLTVRTEPFPPRLKHLTWNVIWHNRHGEQAYVVDSYIGEKDPGW